MLGEKISKLRKHAGYSQEALAEKLGVSRQTVAKWESGDRLPDLEMGASLARLFGVTLDSLTDNDVQNGIPQGKYAFGAVRMGEKGQIVLPKKCREIFGLNKGDLLMLLGDIERGIALLKITPEMFRVFEEAPSEETEEEECSD